MSSINMYDAGFKILRACVYAQAQDEPLTMAIAPTLGCDGY